MIGLSKLVGGAPAQAPTRASKQAVLGLVGIQFADGAFNAVALYDLAQSTRWGRWAKAWAKEDLDHLQFPERFRFVFPIIKMSSAAGLVVGLRWRVLGRVTAASLAAYFLVAVGFHVRARDHVAKFLPAVAMLALSCRAFRSLARGGRRPLSFALPPRASGEARR